jgi:hypothetical protein
MTHTTSHSVLFHVVAVTLFVVTVPECHCYQARNKMLLDVLLSRLIPYADEVISISVGLDGTELHKLLIQYPTFVS